MAENAANDTAGPPTKTGQSSAESTTGSSPPGLKRSRTTRNVNRAACETNDKHPSPHDGRIANDGNDETRQTHAPPTQRPKTTKNKRIKWTKDEQIELFRCYCESIKLKLTASKGTFEIWRKKNPTSRPNMTPNTLSNQRRYAEKHILTDREMTAIKTSVLGSHADGDQDPETERTQILEDERTQFPETSGDDVARPTTTATTENVRLYNNTTDIRPKDQEEPSQEKLDEMQEELIVRMG